MAGTNRSCDSQELTLFHYAELPPEEMARVSLHLEHCPACCREIEEIRNTLHALPEPSAPPGPQEVQTFAAQVLSRRRGWSLGAGTSPFGRGMAIAAALLLMLLFYATPPQEIRQQEASQELSLTAADQIELLENMELLENLDLLQALVEERS